MQSKTRLLIAFSLVGWTALYLFNKWSRQKIRRKENRLMTDQLHTWEGEGGNLPVVEPRSPESSLGPQ